MINIKKSFYLLIALLLSSCMEPNSENLWSISQDNIMDTQGFCRSVTISNGKAYIASGQSGLQIWDLSTNSVLDKFYGYTEAGSYLEFEDLALIERDELNSLIFISESNKDVKIFNYDDSRVLNYRNTIMSARTKEFISFPMGKDKFVMYGADNDDGLKWNQYSLDTTDFYGVQFIEWKPIVGGEITTNGKPLGISINGGSLIAMAVDQLGVELFNLDSLGAQPVLIGGVDLQGNSKKVAFTDNGLFIAADDAGAFYIQISDFTDSLKTIINFAEDFTANHVSLNDDILVLSLGSKGIALYDISEPNLPKERGVFSIGYTYSTLFHKGSLYACTRDGLIKLRVIK